MRPPRHGADSVAYVTTQSSMTYPRNENYTDYACEGSLTGGRDITITNYLPTSASYLTKQNHLTDQLCCFVLFSFPLLKKTATTHNSIVSPMADIWTIGREVVMNSAIRVVVLSATQTCCPGYALNIEGGTSAIQSPAVQRMIPIEKRV